MWGNILLCQIKWFFLAGFLYRSDARVSFWVGVGNAIFDENIKTLAPQFIFNKQFFFFLIFFLTISLSSSDRTLNLIRNEIGVNKMKNCFHKHIELSFRFHIHRNRHSIVDGPRYPSTHNRFHCHHSIDYPIENISLFTSNLIPQIDIVM